MKYLFLFVSFLLIISCSKDPVQPSEIEIQELTGAVQKGPFLNGTSIDIFEYTSDFKPTGRSFSSQILNNQGVFKLNNIVLESEIAILRADGFYFNEVTGVNSQSQIKLFTYTNLAEKSTVNVNILTHLEKGRIEYLLENVTSNFQEAKERAQKEVLSIFSFDEFAMNASEELDISQQGDENAILLAVSIITQGYRSESEMNELLANIATDIREDGELNDSTLGTELINHVLFMNKEQVRTNLENRYAELNDSAIIPDFEKYLQHFIDNTTYVATNLIQYPAVSNYGENILHGDKTNFGSEVSLAAEIPLGTSLKIVIKGGTWYYQSLPNGPINWTISIFDNGEQTFTVTKAGETSDLIMQFESGIYTIEYYENNDTTPTRIKEIEI